MPKKRILSFILCIFMLGSCLPCRFVSADSGAKNERTVYLHAQGSTPDGTDRSVVYKGETAELYLAIDNPNKGDYDETGATDTDKHKEPQYDLNGYTVTISFDPAYFALADGVSASSPIDYTVPDKSVDTSQTGSEKGEDVPTTVGYYVYKQGSNTVDGYQTAYVTVFYNGGYVPQKKDGQVWYNLCKLPLKPLKTGSTEVFIDTSNNEGGLKLFAKNNSEKLEDQTFLYTAVNGGSHTIVIQDKPRPSVPTATPNAGSYDEKQTVTLAAESGCEIYYATDGVHFDPYTTPIEIETTTTVTCYAKRTSDSTESNRVSYAYTILPKAPRLFDSGETAIPNIYTSDDRFTVYAADKASYGGIEAGNEIYYTFSEASADTITLGTDPETGWVKLDKRTQSIEINKNRTVRLVTDRMGTLSDVSEYRFGIKPAKVTASPTSGSYNVKQDITFSTTTTGAKIFYTTDGSDPKTNGIEYSGTITLAKDTTLRAVAKYDGTYGDVSSFYYLFTAKDDYGVDAFYPSGVYEGSVNVTLTANDPENTIQYSTNGGNTWQNYENTLVLDKDTNILAKAVDKDGNKGSDYTTFTYKIKPLAPVFAPESTQFTNADEITVYCVESDENSTDRFELYYTLDGSDPTTSASRIKADDVSDSAMITITKYTVVKAAVLKDGTYSNVVSNSYDIVSKKPSRPLMTLTPGSYTREIGDDTGFSTQFMPVPAGTEIYYTISYDGTFTADPIPNTTGTVKYDGKSITVEGRTMIKAVAVNVFGVKSDIGIFEYTVTSEAPKAAPSATISGDTLPVVPVSAVKGCTVKYDVNGFENEFVCENDRFYIDTATGNAYKDKACTQPLGTQNTGTISAPATLRIRAELDGIESEPNSYTYSLSGDGDTLAPPYADKDTGEYEEIKADDDNNILYINLYSLNDGDTIWYKIDNSSIWTKYTDTIKIKNDTILQVRSERNGNYSASVSYVYNFVPLAPVITLPSGRYLMSDNKTIEIQYDNRAPSDKTANDYQIMYRANGDKQDYPYSAEREINHTMSFKAYVKNTKTGRTSKNTIHYYIIEPESVATGSVYIANPYDVSRISADVLDAGEYGKGIKLLTQKNDAVIHYFCTYTWEDGSSVITQHLVYNNTPITVNASMKDITITAWLTDTDGNEISGSKETFPIAFVHLEVPETSLDSDKVEFSKGTTYTIRNDYPNDENILLYYTLDGSDPSDESNGSRKRYAGETLTLDAAVTVKTVYLSVCGKCVYCKDDKPELCTDKVYGKTGVYQYTVPAVTGDGGSGDGGDSSGGGDGGTTTVDNTRKYTKDIFGNEHPTHIGYINGYPDGSVKPDGEITREEMASVLYRIVNHDYEEPFVATGEAFLDVSIDRWSAHDIEYMSDKNIVNGYPDGEFKPQNNLTRAEFATLISRFAKLEKTDKENPFLDLDKSHWAYDDILALHASGLMQGYEDGTYRPENNITRAEVMTVINKILGRNPSQEYVKSLDYNPFNDLERDKWYYTAVLEATITHDYYLDDNDL